MSSQETSPSSPLQSLDALPLDIKLQIFASLADISSISNLTLASRQFYNTYNRYKTTIKTSIILNNLTTEEEAREAALLVKAQPFLNNNHSDDDVPPTSMKEIRNFIDDHYPSHAEHYHPDDITTYILPPPKPWFSMSEFTTNIRSPSSSDSEEYTNHLLHNHSCISYLTDLFFQKRLYEGWFSSQHPHIKLNQSQPPTVTEKQRVRIAFYRLWILLILNQIYTDSPDQQWYDPYIKTYKVNRDEVCQVFHSVGFWDVRNIFVVYNFLLKVLRPYNTPFLSSIEVKPESDFFASMEGNGGVLEVGWNYNENEMRWFQPWMLTRLLLWELPSGIKTLLVQHSPESDYAQGKMEDVRRYYDRNPYGVPVVPEDVAEFTYMLKMYNRSIDGIPANYRYCDEDESGWYSWAGMGIESRRLFVERGGKYCRKGGWWALGVCEEDKYVWISSRSGGWVDLHACIWDDWRLEASGYHEFEEEEGHWEQADYGNEVEREGRRLSI